MGAYDTLVANAADILPAPNSDVPGWHTYFNNLGLTDVESQIALMGSHTMMDDWPGSSMFEWSADYFKLLTDHDLKIELHDLVFPCEKGGADFDTEAQIEEFAAMEASKFTSTPFAEKIQELIEVSRV